MILDPYFIRKNFRFPKAVKHWSVPLLIFSTSETQDLDNPSPSPSPIYKIFWHRKFPKPQHRKVLLRNFLLLWDNNFSIENRVIPNEGLTISLSGFFETHKGSSAKYSGTAGQKNFRRRIVTYPCQAKNFRYPKLLRH